MLGEEVNVNGRLVRDWIIENDVILKNLEIPGKETWRQGERKSAIDFIIVNEVLRGKCSEMLVDEDHNIGIKSDHYMVALGVEMKMVKKKEKNKWVEVWRKKNVNWKRYENVINEKLHCMNVDEEIGDRYKRWEHMVLSVAEKVVGKIRIKLNGRNKSKSWWNEEIAEKIDKRKVLNKRWRRLRRRKERGGLHLDHAIRQAQEGYEKQKEEVTVTIRDAKNESEEERINDWSDMDPSDRSRAQWTYFNGELKGCNPVERITLKCEGREVEDEKEIGEVAEDYWRKIFWDDAVEEDRLGLNAA
jgi:hypothetical protein